ncbi:hypothetical protein TWF718_000440 [Orbilia javanica]|uniref:CHAT domain-containing protein n=1 Tax=Orbilia javanica TaxID=47235 RepID=A0AAN8N4C1_9PEZI
MVVNATPQNHPNRAGRLNNLGSRLGTRFDRTGSINDLNRAVEAADMAINATPQDHPNRAACLNNLGNGLGTRFDRTGSINDLNRAVEAADMAVNATPQDHPDRAACLNNLGNWLGTRFDRIGSMDDLNRAVEVADMAVNATPQDHPDRASHLSNLGNKLGRRFERTGSIDDLNRAVEVANMAVNATPRDHPDRAGRLSNLGSWVGTRFERTDSIDDLNRAVEVTDMAVNAIPQDHPNRAACLNNLGNRLGRRFERTGSIDDLNRAVEVTYMAVNATPRDHPDRAGRLSNLGNWLGTRFDRTGSMDDLNRALSSYKEGWHCYTAPPSIRVKLATQAARIFASQLNWEASSSLLEEAVKLLPAVSPRLLKHTDKQSMLAEFAGLASMAAAVSLNAGKDAYCTLRLLELGRGVIAGLLMDMRGDVSSLEQRHSDLANKFISLRDALDSPLDRTTLPTLADDMPSWESQAILRHELDHKFSELIATIRAQPGFDNFLLPPTEMEMKNAACFGPIIIINLSFYRCDAFLVQRDKIEVLKLPRLTIEKVQEQAQDLRLRSGASPSITPTLEWLWDAVCGPSLEKLDFINSISDDNWPRVWWIPTGLLDRLPLHAAGYHEQGSTETVLDRVMSSYASSIKALIHGRRNRVRNSAISQADHALLVAMKQTPDLPMNQILLPSVEKEVKMLEELCLSLRLKPITPTLRKDDVLKYMQECKIFHFAGHGSSHPTEPSQSYLLLEDWKTNPLTVGDIRDCKFQENPPFLGYLSACLTGANEAEKLADEGVHLVSAFQLAGFRHVIGTLWEVSDEHCVDMARVFYETMRDEGMTDVAVCRGLHRAMRALRDGQIGEEVKAEARNGILLEAEDLTNPHWVPYIHFGV